MHRAILILASNVLSMALPSTPNRTLVENPKDFQKFTFDQKSLEESLLTLEIQYPEASSDSRRQSKAATFEDFFKQYSEGRLSCRKKIVSDANGNSFSTEIYDEFSKIQNNFSLTDQDLIEAEAFGIWKMKEFYTTRQLKLYSLGLFLKKDHPAQYVAAFNKQTNEAKHLAAFAYAALASSTMLLKKYTNLSKGIPLSRQGGHKTALNEQCPRRGIPQCLPASLKYRTADGSCNNPQHLWWGSTMSTMVRFLPAVYDDGIQEIRRSINGQLLPSPREISNIIHEDKNFPLDGVSHMLMQWGQFVDHDVTATAQSTGFNGIFPQCCLEKGVGFQPPELMHPDCLPIPVSRRDTYFSSFGVRCLEFVRSSPAPQENCDFGSREQLTQVTSFLDGSMIYGSNAEHSDSLRLFRDGLLQYGSLQSRKQFLPVGDPDSLCQKGSLSTKCFRAGDQRLSEQPALISLHIVFLRLHNGIARKLSVINNHWNDEKLYQEARRIVGAFLQLITYREYLPIVLGHDISKTFDLEINKEGYYKGYNVTINPTIANSFSTAAYRFGHSLVQQSFIRVDDKHRPVFRNVTIHEEFNNGENLHTAGSVDRLLLGLVNQPCQRRDEFITSELTNHLFQTPNFKFGMDLASINIQRGRDHGIPSYTDWRSICGLSKVTRWIDFERVASLPVARKFRKIYASVKDVDLFTAGLAEKPVKGGLIGPTFACIIAQQFSNLRKGDRFWFENDNQENSFSPAQLRQIKSVTLAQILCHTMENIKTIQPFVFLTPDVLKNKRVDCNDKIIGQFNFDPWTERLSKNKKELPVKNGPNLEMKNHGGQPEALNFRKGDDHSKLPVDDRSRIIYTGNEGVLTKKLREMIRGFVPTIKPYVPHNSNDINNPNPTNYGFNAKPLNNFIPRNAFFQHFARVLFKKDIYRLNDEFELNSQESIYKNGNLFSNVTSDPK